jgi:hypothetical protein
MSNGRPWAAPPAALGAGAPPANVVVDGLEITQSIQDMAQSVTLVAGKKTAARVYLSTNGPTPINVRGELTIGTAPNTTVVYSTNVLRIDPALNGQLAAKRSDVTLGLLFRIPVNLTVAGSQYFTLTAIRNADTAALLPITGVATRLATFGAVPPLRVRVLGMRYTLTPGGPSFEPRDLDFNLIRSWLGRAYPVADVVFSSAVIASNYQWPFTADQINAQLTAIRHLDMASGGDPRTHYFGLVYDGEQQSQFMRGKASDIPTVPDATAVASGPTGSSTWGWDNDGSYGDWYTGHELAHTFGRFHPGFCSGNTADDPAFPYPGGLISSAAGEFVGFDFGDEAMGLQSATMPGTSWHDLMTYCDYQWPSAYTYEGIRHRLLAENLPAGPGGPPPAAPPGAAHGAGPVGSGGPGTALMKALAQSVKAPDQNWLSVIATINLTRQTGHIEFVQPIASTAMAKPAGGQALVASVRLRDVNGATISETPVDVRLGSCALPGEDRTGLVDAVVSAQANARFVDVLLNGNVVDTFAAAPKPPQIANLQAASAAPGDKVSLKWDAQHPASSITYSVQVSTDQGRSWQTVAVRRPTPDYDLDPKSVGPAKTVHVRVLATDGFTSHILGDKEVTLP